MQCSNCGTMNADTSNVCITCGTNLSYWNQYANQQTMGGQFVNNQQPMYQQPVYQQPIYQQPVYQQPVKKSKVWQVVLIPIAVVAIIAGGIGCYFWFGSQSSNDVASGKAETSSEEGIEPDNDVSAQVSTQASVDELVGYIDRAQDLVVKAFDDVDALFEEEASFNEIVRKQAVILENALSDLSDLRIQADAVSGIDANLENAKKEYFNMEYNSLKAYYEIWCFFGDFVDLADILDLRPIVDEYNYFEDYYYDLCTWYASAKEGYSAISSCPPCLKSEWKQFGDVLDINGNIIDKWFEAYLYDDVLRAQSAVNMSDRYDTVVMLQVNEIMDGASGESDFFAEQLGLFTQLAGEIHNYAEMGEEERGGYEFEYVCPGEIRLSYDTVDTIYPSLYNTYDAFLIIKTGCVSGSRTILVEAEIPGFTQTYKESFTLDSAYRIIYIKPPALTGDLDISSAKDAQINVTISDQDGNLIEAKTFPVTIQSKYDVQWYTDEYGVATQDNILCFLTPEASAISQLKRQAIEEISDMTGGDMESFVGYQEVYENHYVNTYIQVAGIMRALYEMGVRYNMDPFSISTGHQHVLYPEDVLEQQSGLCIETSLVVASALQSANMHVFLVLPPGHAQVAVEVWPGTGEYFLIETTALSSASNNRSVFIENANELFNYNALNTSPVMYYNTDDWENYLDVPGTYIIDCNDSSVLGLTPFSN